MALKLSFTSRGWADYVYWQQQDKKVLKKINSLVKEIIRNPSGGIGKPEELKNELSGYWSRRINKKDRLVYSVSSFEILIVACRYHYD